MWTIIETDTNANIRSDRLKVPGGWIVRSCFSYASYAGGGCAIHQVFVPDPTHEWELKNESKN